MPLTIAKYRVLKQSIVEKRATPGTIIYAFISHDYGIPRLDTRHHKEPWAAFTFNEDGDYPFFTMPIKDVERII